MNPVTLVTGASSGVGRVTAIALAARGHRVFGTSRSPSGGSGPVEMLPLSDVDAHVFNDDPVIWYAAVWAHSVIYGAMKSPDKPSRKMLDRLLELWLANIDKTPHGLITPFGLADGPVFIDELG